MSHQRKVLGDTVYFWFGSNDTSGSGDDGATPLADVRLAGATITDAPILSPTPALISHVNYPAGAYELAVAATTGNGFAASNTYSVFATLAVDSQNPTGFLGSFELAANVNSSGYDDGAIWVNTNLSNTNTNNHIDGVVDNPVSTWAAALTLSGSLGITRFRIGNESSITLTGDSTDYVMIGENWALALGGQTVADIYVEGAVITGTGSGDVRFRNCSLATSGTLTLSSSGYFNNCALQGVFALSGIGANYTFDGCWSNMGGASIPDITYGGAGMTVRLRHYSGEIEIKSMAAAQNLILEGKGALTINASCTGGDATIRGHFSVTDNASAAVTLAETTRFETTNVIDANIKQISDDTVPADNLELQYDGTGLTGDTFPSTQLQLSQVAAVGAAINTAAESYLLTTGTQSSGTFADTAALDGVHHQHTDTAGAMELYYQFDVGADGVPTAATVTGRINGSNDSLDGIYAYNWLGTTWDRVGDFAGQTSSVDVVRTYDLFTSHVGTGVNQGKVRIRFYAAAGLTGAELFIDQIFASYAVVARSVGYANGAVWIDTVNGTAGVVSYVNGTADQPVLTLADAITIAGNLNLSRFEVIGGSTITFAESHDSEQWNGANWTLALGGQSVSGSAIFGATVSGICTGAIRPKFGNCTLGTVTLPPCRINSGSGFTGTLTLGSAGDFDLISCTSLVAGAATPTIDLGAAVGATNMSIRNWSGGLTFNNILAGDVISLEGLGGIITINGTGGSIYIRGIFQGVVDNSSDAVTIVETATLNREALVGYTDGSVWIDTANGVSGVREYVNGTQINPVDNLADAYTIMASLGLSRVQIEQMSSLTLPSDSSYKSFRGENYTVDLNGQNIEGATFESAASITGIGTGGTLTDVPTFIFCAIGTVTLPPSNGFQCGFFGTFTMSSEGNYTFGQSGSVFNATAIFDFGSGLNASGLYLGYNGGMIEVQNMGAGTGTYTLDVFGLCDLTINANCSDTSTVILRGNIDLTNNSAITTITEEVNYSATNVNGEVLDVLVTDTFAEVSVPAATSSIKDMLHWIFSLSRNKGIQTSTTKTLRNDADSGDLGTSGISAVAGVFTRDEYT